MFSVNQIAGFFNFDHQYLQKELMDINDVNNVTLEFLFLILSRFYLIFNVSIVELEQVNTGAIKLYFVGKSGFTLDFDFDLMLYCNQC